MYYILNNTTHNNEKKNTILISYLLNFLNIYIHLYKISSIYAAHYNNGLVWFFRIRQFSLHKKARASGFLNYANLLYVHKILLIQLNNNLPQLFSKFKYLIIFYFHRYYKYAYT